MIRRVGAGAAAVVALGVAAAGALAVAGAGARAIEQPQATHKVPPRHRFSGHVTAATGQYAGDRGMMWIVVRTQPHAGRVRNVTLTIAGGSRSQSASCLTLNGTLRGTLSLVPQPHAPADVGRVFAINATGTIAPLGSVTAKGVIHGTGNIARGREGMRLTLVASAGNVTLHAHSGLVRAFTAP